MKDFAEICIDIRDYCLNEGSGQYVFAWTELLFICSFEFNLSVAELRIIDITCHTAPSICRGCRHTVWQPKWLRTCSECKGKGTVVFAYELVESL